VKKTPLPIQGVILLAHGSRAPGWDLPLKAWALELQRRLVEHGLDSRVTVAALSMAMPDLEVAVGELVRDCATDIRVIPALLTRGAHLREDVPVQIANLRKIYPRVTIALSPSLGEIEEVRRAAVGVLAASLLRQG